MCQFIETRTRYRLYLYRQTCEGRVVEGGNSDAGYLCSLGQVAATERRYRGMREYARSLNIWKELSICSNCREA